MGEVLDAAVASLSEKIGSNFTDGSVRFDIADEGSVFVDASGARAATDDADVVMAADADVFQQIMEGELDPTAAFMTGKLTVDGDMGLALKLGAYLS